MDLDDDDLEIALLGLRIAVQSCGDAIGVARTHDAASKCINFCLPKLAGLIKRIEQRQLDAADERADG